MPENIYASEAGRYRSGTAARLAGLSVETLRVWERRYGISNAVRSEHGQRLYSDAQVARLRLMKQLVDQGHAIGALAHLPPDQLSTLPTRPDPAAPARPVRVALVGLPLAQRVAGQEVPGLEVVAECADLDTAAAAFAHVDMDVLLLEVAELDERAMPAIAALRQQCDAAVVVLYRFCASAVIRQLRTLGCLVARAPGDAAEIVLLCQTALPVQARRPPAPPVAPAPARRFDDHSLAVLSAARNSIHCDCPRHLSEILLLLNSFERYSSQCAQRTPEDAVLHEELKQTAGAARVLLEDALERLARADGLPLPPGL
ncbi:MerR family transcriptional regulator [Massilia sp. CF038]|uniref:MerR family transcriptional regulator n=1 Tax=Massilia sp. CF038 TaxID=1881045 RepID=UPI0009110EE6|nr:MerR family transcriptional regulator [Massilia sp. CF038]SHG62828.1 DNA-binding transcriptional regulator, MerR family [Massilia sp. CF038]